MYIVDKEEHLITSILLILVIKCSSLSTIYMLILKSIFFEMQSKMQSGNIGFKFCSSDSQTRMRLFFCAKKHTTDARSATNIHTADARSATNIHTADARSATNIHDKDIVLIPLNL